VWIVPTAIRYRFVDDVRPALDATLTRLERRLLLDPRPGGSLAERIVRVGDVLLTIREKQTLGRAGEGPLAPRVAQMIETILARQEAAHLTGTRRQETVPLRVKALRRHLLDLRAADVTPPDLRAGAQAGLDEVQLALTLYSYPGDYVGEKPTVERIAETIEKLEEDVEGRSSPKGRRAARVVFGEPIDVAKAAEGARTKAAAGDLTDRVEDALRTLMKGADDGREADRPPSVVQ
jgi:hypothetical protein